MKKQLKSDSSIIQILLDILEQDRKQVMLLVVLCFAIPSFTITNINLFNTHFIIRLFLMISLFLFICSGMFYFFYTQKNRRTNALILLIYFR